MSRFSFSKIVSSAPDQDLEDILGHSIGEWLSVGVVGYDEPLQTFFFNLEDSWVIGTSLHELPTIADLQRVIAAIFKGIAFPFDPAGLVVVAAGYEESAAILSPEEAASGASQISAEYLEIQVSTANFYRNQ
ncbi:MULTISPECIES: hypothetical protein [Pseudomonas]|uniref:hypothetical protein n=1 Tax=Pseudomonas TaxID=286 RepID=UPI0018E76500|nr:MULTISPECIES: hypothetical protein [Pseudomonas]MBJ2214097.1 hypothetical protein [Pseudomonas carnis]MBP5947965.1 hypothetical protein [Pseudomonas sp. P9(2020)]